MIALIVYLHGGGPGLLPLWTALGAGAIGAAGAIGGAIFSQRGNRQQLYETKRLDAYVAILQYATWLGDETWRREQASKGGPPFVPEPPPIDLNLAEAMALAYASPKVGEAVRDLAVAHGDHTRNLASLEAVPVGQAHRPQRAAVEQSSSALMAAKNKVQDLIRSEHGLPAIPARTE